MNRRDTLKKLIVATGSLVVLPAWAKDWSVDAMTAHHSSFSMAEQDTLGAVADTIIPKGNAIGALSVGVDKFLQKLIDNCYDKDVQNNVKLQLAGLDTTAQGSYGKPFAACDQAEREALLMKLSKSENKAESDFFNLLKSETIRGFNTSREVMVNYFGYKPVPGHYHGCVDVKA